MFVDEKIMVVVLFLIVGFWIFGFKFGVGFVVVAFNGLVIFFVFGVIIWKECFVEGLVWDMFVWFVVFIVMVGYLNMYGLILVFFKGVVGVVFGFGLAW